MNLNFCGCLSRRRFIGHSAFGLDYGKVTFKCKGADGSLTDNQGGRVVKEILAWNFRGAPSCGDENK